MKLIFIVILKMSICPRNQPHTFSEPNCRACHERKRANQMMKCSWQRMNGGRQNTDNALSALAYTQHYRTYLLHVITMTESATRLLKGDSVRCDWLTSSVIVADTYIIVVYKYMTEHARIHTYNTVTAAAAADNRRGDAKARDASQSTGQQNDQSTLPIERKRRTS